MNVFIIIISYIIYARLDPLKHSGTKEIRGGRRRQLQLLPSFYTKMKIDLKYLFNPILDRKDRFFRAKMHRTC
jgi:hypothetical protein